MVVAGGMGPQQCLLREEKTSQNTGHNCPFLGIYILGEDKEDANMVDQNTQKYCDFKNPLDVNKGKFVITNGVVLMKKKSTIC